MPATTRTGSENLGTKSTVSELYSVKNDISPVLSLRGVELQRGEHFRLMIDHLSLIQGQVYLLHGPNGSGKSTLLHLLALLLAPDCGDVLFTGRPVSTVVDKKRFRRQITLVEQDPYLFDSKVYDNLAFGLRLRKIPTDLQRHRIARALQTVGLSGYESRPAKELSGGEIRRIALARALVLQPTVLLLDETTAGLDRETLPLLEIILADLVQRGVTIVLACHNPSQLGRLVTENIHLFEGQIHEPNESSSITKIVQCQSV
jgi:tungstate transport system ATP-binding protein